MAAKRRQKITILARGEDPRRGSVAMGFVTGMLSGPRARGIDVSVLLAKAGIESAELSDPKQRVSLAAYTSLYNLVVAQLDDEGFGLFKMPLRPGCFEFLCRSVLHAAALEDALDRACRFMRLVLPDLQLEISRREGCGLLEIRETSLVAPARSDACRVFAFEWLLRLIHSLACWLVGRSIVLSEVAFPYPRPRHVDDYRLIYTEHSSFDSPVLAAKFEASVLDLPVRQDEEALARFLEGAPGKIAMLYRRDRETVHLVRDIVAKLLPDAVSLDQVARELHLSPRTLHRRLRGEGSSFRAIKDSLRKNLALAAVDRKRIAQIAADLGYSEPSAFFRAFRKWTGVAPTSYRRKNAP